MIDLLLKAIGLVAITVTLTIVVVLTLAVIL